MIKFITVANTLNKSEEKTFIPRTLVNECIDLYQIIQEVSRGTTVMPADAKAVLENLSEITMNNLKKGRSVDLGFVHFRPIVKGIFHSHNEPFSSNNHKLDISVSASKSFKKQITVGTSVSHVNQNKIVPVIFDIENLSDPNAEFFKHADMAKIHGKDLFFNRENSDLGLFFYDGNNYTQVIEYGEIKAKSIIFKIPSNLIAGTKYKIIIKTQLGQEIKRGELFEEFEITN